MHRPHDCNLLNRLTTSDAPFFVKRASFHFTRMFTIIIIKGISIWLNYLVQPSSRSNRKVCNACWTRFKQKLYHWNQYRMLVILLGKIEVCKKAKIRFIVAQMLRQLSRAIGKWFSDSFSIWTLIYSGCSEYLCVLNRKRKSLWFYCNLIRQWAPGMGTLSLPCLSQSPLNAELHEQSKIILRTCLKRLGK